jgi:hypothetical protein
MLDAACELRPWFIWSTCTNGEGGAKLFSYLACPSDTSLGTRSVDDAHTW